MHSIVLAAVCATALFAAAAPAGLEVTVDPSRTIVVDGHLGEWASVTPVRVDRIVRSLSKMSRPEAADLSATVRLASDSTCLFIAFEVMDEDLVPASTGPLWKFDSVEWRVGVAMRPFGSGRDVVVRVAPQRDGGALVELAATRPHEGGVHAAAYTGNPHDLGIRSAVVLDAGKYSVEISLPINLVISKPGEEAALHMWARVYDADASTPADSVIQSSGGGSGPEDFEWAPSDRLTFFGALLDSRSPSQAVVRWFGDLDVLKRAPEGILYPAKAGSETAAAGSVGLLGEPAGLDGADRREVRNREADLRLLVHSEIDLQFKASDADPVRRRGAQFLLSAPRDMMPVHEGRPLMVSDLFAKFLGNDRRQDLPHKSLDLAEALLAEGKPEKSLSVIAEVLEVPQRPAVIARGQLIRQQASYSVGDEKGTIGAATELIATAPGRLNERLASVSLLAQWAAARRSPGLEGAYRLAADSLRMACSDPSDSRPAGHGPHPQAVLNELRRIASEVRILEVDDDSE